MVADAFTKSATAKIEAAGGVTTVLEVPAEIRPALGLDSEGVAIEREARVPRTAAGREAADRKAEARARRTAEAAPTSAAVATEPAEKAVKPEKPKKADAPTPVTEAVGADEPAGVAEAPDVTEIDAADATTDEPADVPDSITEPAAEREPVTGDDTDNSGEPTGDESA